MATNVDVEIIVRTKLIEEFSPGIKSTDRNEFIFANASIDNDLVEDVRVFIERHLVAEPNVEQQIV